MLPVLSVCASVREKNFITAVYKVNRQTRQGDTRQGPHVPHAGPAGSRETKDRPRQKREGGGARGAPEEQEHEKGTQQAGAVAVAV